MLHPNAFPCISNLVTMHQLDLNAISFVVDLKYSAIQATVLCKEAKRLTGELLNTGSTKFVSPFLGRFTVKLS